MLILMNFEMAMFVVYIYNPTPEGFGLQLKFELIETNQACSWSNKFSIWVVGSRKQVELNSFSNVKVKWFL